MIDTDPEIERRLIEIYRYMSMQEKWYQLGAIFQAAKHLAAAGSRLRNSCATAAEVHDDWLERTVGSVPIRSGKATNATG